MSALTDLFTSLANKIRNKLGTSTTYTPAQAISAIDDVYTKGVNDTFANAQEKTVTAGTSTASVTPDSGKLLSKVTYNPTPSQSKSASPSTSAQTISPDSGKLLSSVSISAISPQRSAGVAATTTGIDSTGPYVYFPYGWHPNTNTTYGNYTRMTAAQAVAACPKQEKTVTSSVSAQTVSPDSGKLLSKVTVNALTMSGTYTASSRGASLDMGASNTYRYVNTNSVPNSNSGTYTPSTHGTALDMGATNTYRYVNTINAYNKGKTDGALNALSLTAVASVFTSTSYSVTNGQLFVGIGNESNGAIPFSYCTVVSRIRTNINSGNTSQYTLMTIKATASGTETNGGYFWILARMG